MEYLTFLATVQAISALLSIWQSERDYNTARSAFEDRYREALDSRETRAAAERLSGLLPKRIITTYRKNLEKCLEQLDDCVQGKDADAAYRRCESAYRGCVCAILRSLVRTNGALPVDLLDLWENASCGLTPTTISEN